VSFFLRNRLIKGNPNHDAKGRFASGPGGGSQGAKLGHEKELHAIFDRLKKPDGGFTYHVTTGQEPTAGYALSIYPDRSFAKSDKDMTFEDLHNYAEKNLDLLASNDHYIGGWHDPRTGRVFLDVSKVTQDENEAHDLALKNDQIAYFDLHNMKSVEVNKDATSGGVNAGEDDAGPEGHEASASHAGGTEDHGRRHRQDVHKADWQDRNAGADRGFASSAGRQVRDHGGQLRVGIGRFVKFNPNHDPDNGQFASGEGGGGGTDGKRSLAEASREAETAAGTSEKLKGLPDKAIEIGKDDYYVPGPIKKIKDTAETYMKDAGLKYDPPKTYAKLDVDRAKKIADAFDKMKHDPSDPKVKASYEALAKEVQAQWDALKSTGIKVEWIKPGQDDPYAKSPRLAAADVARNNHWWGFPTDMGFGSGPEAEAAKKDNPLLRETGEVIDGRKVVVNDVFRIVHDIYGHFKEGVGFRAGGEENAWRIHASMFSKDALPAMTSETRGQNSWVNYGPHGDTNRTANSADTQYAPQKIGLMPEWTWTDGAKDKS
jgi:hypothetical protein